MQTIQKKTTQTIQNNKILGKLQENLGNKEKKKRFPMPKNVEK